jgi:hypothetical protein
MGILNETAIKETIKQLPDESTEKDIKYKLDFVAQVLASVKDAESGKLLTTEELLNRVKQWAE